MLAQNIWIGRKHFGTCKRARHNCSQIFGLAQKIWTDTKHFGTCKRTRHKTLLMVQTVVCNKFSENSPYLRAIESMNFLALLVAVGVFCSVCSGSSVSLLGFRTYRETFSSEGFRPSSRINRFRSSPLTSADPMNVIKNDK